MFGQISTVTELSDLPEADIRQFLIHGDYNFNIPDAYDISGGQIRATCNLPNGQEIAVFSGNIDGNTFSSDTGHTREVRSSRLRGLGFFSKLHDRLMDTLAEEGVKLVSVETRKISTAKFFAYKSLRVVDGLGNPMAALCSIKCLDSRPLQGADTMLDTVNLIRRL